MKRLAAFLILGMAGVAALLLGLSLDAYRHARDATLAHREGIFTLSNPGHVLLGVGIALVVVGLVGAAYTSLPVGIWVRRGLLLGSLGLIVLSGDVSGWAASPQWSAPNTTLSTAHNHAPPPPPGVTPPPPQPPLRLIDTTRVAAAKYANE